MRSMFRTALVTLVAALAMGALTSSSALAASTNNPQWEINKKILGEGESAEMTAKASGRQILSSSLAEIECTKLKVQTGAKMLGSKAPASGSANETIVYEECEVNSFPGCEINKGKAGKAKITTDPLTTTLVFETKEAAEKETGATLSLLKPSTGKTFAPLELSPETGEACPTKGNLGIAGEVAFENIEGAVAKESHELRSLSRISKAFVNEGGKTVEKSVVGLKLGGGVAMTYLGIFEVTLTSKALWNVFG